ncbi:MAG: FAD-linked oxidase C-terminal domain-containing protein, partial [Dehalococcoidia bacterium]
MKEMEYCHGVGVRLAYLMDRELGYGLGVMKRIKEALDPDNIMDPGEISPRTLAGYMPLLGALSLLRFILKKQGHRPQYPGIGPQP